MPYPPPDTSPAPPCAPQIRHDNSETNPSWHLQQIVLVDELTGERMAFPCNDWLASDKGDKQVGSTPRGSCCCLCPR